MKSKFDYYEIVKVISANKRIKKFMGEKALSRVNLNVKTENGHIPLISQKQVGLFLKKKLKVLVGSHLKILLNM